MSDTEAQGPAADGRASPGFGDLLVALTISTIAGGMLLLGTGFSAEARRLPIVVGTPFVFVSVLNTIVIATSVFRSGAKAGMASPRAKTELRGKLGADATGRQAISGVGREPRDQVGMGFGSIAAAVVILVSLFVAFGLVASAVIFTPLFMRWSGRQPWWRAALVTTSLVAAFLSLAHFFSLRLYTGKYGIEDIVGLVMTNV